MFEALSRFLKYFLFVISQPSHFRNRLFRFLGPNPSRKGVNNSLYKGFIVVINIHSEIDFNKIPTRYLSCDSLLTKCNCYSRFKLLLPKPLNIDPYTRTLQDFIKKSNLVLNS